MAEEQRCEAAPRLCANNCGFFGSPTTQNLCSKCYRDLQLKEQQSSHAKHALNQTLTAALSSSSSSSSSPSSSSACVDLPEVTAVVLTAAAEEEEEQPRKQAKNRCSTCRKRVGLMGFECRCGMVFCGSHRYPEQHDCGFDFKGLGKAQIAKANPVVKADKLHKI